MTILGIHHISIMSADARRTADFYTRVLGLRLVKQTVDIDSPDHYHLVFGDELGRPGTLVTLYEVPGLRHGHPGIGGTHHFAFIVESPEAQLKWKRRLTDLGLGITGVYNRVYFQSIYFRDPDGTILEIATRQPGFAVDEPLETLGQALRPPPLECMDGHRDEAAIAARTWPEPVPGITPDMRLPGIHHITVIGSDIERTTEFYVERLGLPLVKRTMNFDDPTSPHYYYGLHPGRPGTLITYFERSPAVQSPVRPGAGQTHHFAFSVDGEAELRDWRERLLSAGLEVSEVRDEFYHQSIRLMDPFGHLVEIATTGPGYTIDEPAADLGSRLKLPPWLEAERQRIEGSLAPVHLRLEAGG